MSWTVNRTMIQITEDDFGVGLPIKLSCKQQSGFKLKESDSIKFVIKTEKNGSIIYSKDFTNIVNNTIVLNFTEQDIGRLVPGNYIYNIDWFQNGVFRYNIISAAKFKVVDKG